MPRDTQLAAVFRARAKTCCSRRKALVARVSFGAWKLRQRKLQSKKKLLSEKRLEEQRVRAASGAAAGGVGGSSSSSSSSSAAALILADAEVADGADDGVLTFDIPVTAKGAVIGRAGKTIQQIQKDCEV